MGLTVLITNVRIAERTGTELQSLGLAQHLLEKGHRPIVYSPVLGALAHHFRARSIPVVSDIGNIDETIDVIHGHHNPTTAIAVARFPEVPAVFVCHDFTAWHDAPPLLPSIRRYVAVDATVRDRLTLEAGIPAEIVELEPNAVDLARFVPAPPLPPRPRRVFAVAKNHGYLDAIRAACKARGIEFDAAGHGAGMQLDAPEAVMGGYDVILATALSAMEAMAMGRAVVCCDGRGLAGMVTTGNYAVWRPLNFGLRCLTSAVTAESVGAALDAYDARDAAQVAATLRAEGGWQDAADRWIERYRKVIAEWRARPAGGAAAQVALARHLQAWLPSLRRGDEWPWIVERDRLVQELGRLASGLEPLRLGTKHDFGRRARANWYAPDRGFWGRGGDSIWAAAKTATFRVWIENPPQAALAASLSVAALPAQDGETPLGVEILVGGHSVLREEVLPRRSAASVLRFRIARELVPENGFLWIEVRSGELRSPRAAGVSPDTREHGLGLFDMTVAAETAGLPA